MWLDSVLEALTSQLSPLLVSGSLVQPDTRLSPSNSDELVGILRRQTPVWLNETRFWWFTTCYMKQRPALQLMNKTIVVVRNDHEQLIFIFSLTKCYSDTITAVLLKITILYYIMWKGFYFVYRNQNSSFSIILLISFSIILSISAYLNGYRILNSYYTWILILSLVRGQTSVLSACQLWLTSDALSVLSVTLFGI